MKSITKTLHLVQSLCLFSIRRRIHLWLLSANLYRLYMGYCDGTAPFVLAMWTVVCSLSKLSGVGFVCFSWWLLCVCCVGVWKDLPWSSCSVSTQLDPPHGRPLGWLAGSAPRIRCESGRVPCCLQAIEMAFATIPGGFCPKENELLRKLVKQSLTTFKTLPHPQQPFVCPIIVAQLCKTSW